MGLIKICAFGLGLLGTIAVWQAGSIVARNTFADLTFAQMLLNPSFSLRILAGVDGLCGRPCSAYRNQRRVMAIWTFGLLPWHDYSGLAAQQSR